MVWKAFPGQVKAPAHVGTIALPVASWHKQKPGLGAWLAGPGHSTHPRLWEQVMDHIRLGCSIHQNAELDLGTDSIGALWVHLCGTVVPAGLWKVGSGDRSGWTMELTR